MRDLSLDTPSPTIRVRSCKGGKLRLVPVHPELHRVLDSALAYGDISQGRIIEAHPTTAWRWEQAAVKRAEELDPIAPGKRIGTHTLRHSYARHLLMAPCPNRYSRRQLRTLQRRVRQWRIVVAKQLVYASAEQNEMNEADRGNIRIPVGDN